jgi:hypothetical protein
MPSVRHIWAHEGENQRLLEKWQGAGVHDLYPSQNTLCVIKFKGMRWVRHVARMGIAEVRTAFWWGNTRETPGRSRRRRRDIIKRIPLKYYAKTCTGLI